MVALFSLYSASHQSTGVMQKNFAMQQLIWMAIAVGLFVFIVWFGYERWLDYAYLIFALNILLLIIVLAIGSTRLGARRWLSIGSFVLQPSEFCKVSFVLVLARYIGDNKNNLGSIKVFITSLLICMVPIFLIIKQPDLGTALVFLPILLMVLFVAGVRLRYMFGLVLTGLLSFPMLWLVLKDYQRQRLLVFLNPNIDPLGAGYTVIQSKIAIGSGGIFGKGWLSGTQNQFNFLPERHSDFIFSVIGEEWGFFGAVLVLVLFLFLAMRLLSITNTTSDLRGKLLVAGVVATLWFQVFVNIAMAIGFMPVVGLPLPLVSYGGSSLISTMVLLALAVSVRHKRKIF